MIAVRTAVDAKLIGNAVRRVRAAGTEGIGDRVRVKFVRGEVAKIFGVDGERDENEKTREQEFHAAPPGWPSA